MLSAARREANRSVSGSLASRSAKSGKRSLIGASSVKPSFLPRKCARARPPPILRPFHQPRPHRIERHVAQCRRQMSFVHGDGAEPTLPEMAAALAPRLDHSGIASMHARQRAAQPIRIGRHQDEVHVVRHQTPSPHLDPGGTAIVGEQVAIKRIVGIAKERARSAVATLGDMVRMIGYDDTGEAGHAVRCLQKRDKSIECTVTVIPAPRCRCRWHLR